jgi:uncharacterized protein YkwD
LRPFGMIVGMDLDAFHRSVYQLLAAITVGISSSLNLSPTPIVNNTPLSNPMATSSRQVIETQVSEVAIQTTFEDSTQPAQEQMIFDESSEITSLTPQVDNLAMVKQDLPKLNPPQEQLKKVQPVLLTPIPTPTPTPLPSPKIKLAAISRETILKSSTSSAITKSDTPKLDIPTVSSSKSKSLNTGVIMQLINTHRGKLNLPPFEKNAELCKLADYRGPQLYDEIFKTHSVHKGLYDLKLPYWITENMAHYPSEQLVVNWWLGSKVHRTAIEGDYKYSCGVCNGNSCAQLFTNFTPKS